MCGKAVLELHWKVLVEIIEKKHLKLLMRHHLWNGQ